MLSNKPVLPNFIKAIVLSTAAAFSISAFAGDHESAEEKIGDLKDMTTSEAKLTKEESKMLKAKSSMTESKTEVVMDEVSEDELAKKAESLTPEK